MRRESVLTVFVLTALLSAAENGVAQEVLRDPTRPYSAPVVLNAAPARFEVNAIINSDKRRLAIVNGRRVGIGDEIDGAVVLAIHKSEVVVEIDDREKTLRLNRGVRQR